MTRRRGGHTLAEVACVTAVIAVLLTALVLVLSGSRCVAARTDLTASAVQATQLLCARIAADLDGAAPGTPVTSESGELAIGDVAYRFDAGTGFVTRNGVTLRCGPFAAVAFALEGPSVAVRAEVRGGTAVRTRVSAPHLAPSRLDAYEPRPAPFPAS